LNSVGRLPVKATVSLHFPNLQPLDLQRLHLEETVVTRVPARQWAHPEIVGIAMMHSNADPILSVVDIDGFLIMLLCRNILIFDASRNFTAAAFPHEAVLSLLQVGPRCSCLPFGPVTGTRPQTWERLGFSGFVSQNPS
jgi:hypothetical protein